MFREILCGFLLILFKSHNAMMRGNPYRCQVITP
jgi:hypothetical protein